VEDVKPEVGDMAATDVSATRRRLWRSSTPRWLNTSLQLQGGNDAMIAMGTDGAQATAGGDTAMDDEMRGARARTYGTNCDSSERASECLWLLTTGAGDGWGPRPHICERVCGAARRRVVFDANAMTTISLILNTDSEYCG